MNLNFLAFLDGVHQKTRTLSTPERETKKLIDPKIIKTYQIDSGARD